MAAARWTRAPFSSETRSTSLAVRPMLGALGYPNELIVDSLESSTAWPGLVYAAKLAAKLQSWQPSFEEGNQASELATLRCGGDCR